MTAFDLSERFPPGFRPVALRERDDALGHAARRAARDGAGTVYHVGRFDLIECAVVFEPEEPLDAARRVVFAGMNALAETIAADALPERTLRFRYPSSIVFDDGLIGGVRLAVPDGTNGADVPDWLALGLMVRSGGLNERGLAMGQTITTLEEAGFRDIDPLAFVARFCRHLLNEVDEWLSEGFASVGERYLARLDTHSDAALRIIEKNGDLTVQPKTGARHRISLGQAIAAAEWYDPELQGPKL